MTLQEKIKQYRTEHRLSQREFAKRCGVTNGYISFLERGCNPQTGKPIAPNFKTLSAIAAAMNMSVDELLKSVDDFTIDLTGASEKDVLETYALAYKWLDSLSPEVLKSILLLTNAPQELFDAFGVEK